MDYVASVEAPAYALAAICFATEGAFTEHSRRLQLSLGPPYDRLVVLAPQLSYKAYRAMHRLAGMADRALDFARLAAQGEWLMRRAQWLREMVDMTGEHAT